MSVAISSDNIFIVSGSVDLTIRVWNTDKGYIFQELKGHTEAVMSV